MQLCDSHLSLIHRPTVAPCYPQQSPDLFSRKVNDSWDEVLAHYDGADLLPISGALAQQQADGLQSQFDRCRRVGHGPHLHQMLLLNGLNS